MARTPTLPTIIIIIIIIIILVLIFVSHLGNSYRGLKKIMIIIIIIKSRFGIGYLACAFILHIYNIRSFGLFMLLVGLLHNPHEFGS